MITLRKNIKLDGSLTDPTSVVLSDPTGTYGVQRDDNSDIVVDPDTPMIRSSTGVYEYSFEPPISGLAYSYFVKVVISGSTYFTEATYVDRPSAEIIGSYATLADGSDYMAGYMKSDPWDDATDAQRTKALVTATRMIDRLNIYGRPLVATQPMQFPRYGTESVPNDIKCATILLANTLLDGVDPELEFENLNLTTQKYSSISSTYDRSTPPEHIVAGIVSIEAWRYLKPYLRDPYTVDLSRVS